MDKLQPKTIFNQDSRERYQDAKMIGGNPNGIISFNQTPHKAAYGMYRTAISRLWFPSQVNTSKDKQNYSKLTPEEKRAFDLVLAQLITNDSIQTNQLMDGINRYITCPVTNALLATQAFQECYVEGTEILTKQGWKDFRDLTMEDYVAAYQDDESVLFEHPYQIINQPYQGPTYVLASNNYYQHVTPGHNLVYVKSMNDRHLCMQNREHYLWYAKAEDIELTDQLFPVAGIHDVPSGQHMLNPLEQLAIAWIFLGEPVKTSAPVGRLKQYLFKIKDPRHEVALENIIKQTGLSYEKHYRHTKRQVSFYLWTTMEFDKHLDWVNPLNRSSSWRRACLWELTKWNTDGIEEVSYQSRHFITDSNKLVDKVQYMAAISRTAAVVSDIHLVQKEVVITPDLMFRHASNFTKTEVPYTGNVVCCTVNSGKIVCRYKGNVFVSGNCVHSESYSVMAEDVAQDTERIFNMHNVDEELHRKNQAVENMYRRLYDKEEHNQYPTDTEILMVFVANQILEELIFPGGFSVGFMLEHKLKGCAEMFTEIAGDESNHVEIFKYIFRTVIKESFDNQIPELVNTKACELIKDMAEVEIRWLLYVTKGLLGYSEASIETFVRARANSICKNLGLSLIYPEQTGPNPIEDLIAQRLRTGVYESRTNFFEANPTEYQKNSLKMDY